MPGHQHVPHTLYLGTSRAPHYQLKEVKQGARQPCEQQGAKAANGSTTYQQQDDKPVSGLLTPHPGRAWLPQRHMKPGKAAGTRAYTCR